jgi:hypothetical protein
VGVGLNVAPLNPLRIMKIWIQQLADGKSSAERLTELYVIWLNLAQRAE